LCSEDWWEGLPHQGTSGKYLKAIGNTHLYPKAEGLQLRVEAFIKPFLEYLAKQYPLLRFWKVGALRMALNAKSQYEKCGNVLHSDYREKVLKQPVEEQPLSMIVALDDFEFFCKLESTETEEYQTTTVKRKQGIAFTNGLFHAGGPNKTDKYVYRLFAYITSNDADYPPGTVFTHTTANVTKLAEARKNNQESSHVRWTGRNTQKPDRYSPSLDNGKEEGRCVGRRKKQRGQEKYTKKTDRYSPSLDNGKEKGRCVRRRKKQRGQEKCVR
jgi:hypothetical protein